MPTARDRTDASATGDSIVINAETKLSKLIKRYAETQVELSWNGSRPVEEFEWINRDA